MAKINLLKNVKIEGKWKLLPVAEKNGKPLWDHVIVGEAVEKHLEGNYHLDYRVNGDRLRPSVAKVLGRDPSAISAGDVREAIAKKQSELRAIDGGYMAAPSKKMTPREQQIATGKRIISTSIEAFLTEKEIRTVKPGRGRSVGRTVEAYGQVLRTFAAHCKKKYVEEVERQDLLDHQRYLLRDAVNRLAPKGKGLSNTTTNQSLDIVSIWLKSEGSTARLLRTDKLANEDPDRKPYGEDDLRAFFAACNPEERDLFQFALGTGFRVGEIAVAEWSDIRWADGVISITAKAQYQFVPKGKLKRMVPLSKGLLDLLAARMVREPKAALIFPRVGIQEAESEYLRACKNVARRAGLNCGECTACKRVGCCENFFLHRFRHSFATFNLRDRVDIRTVSAWMGHKSLVQTMKYLEPATGIEAQGLVNSGRIAEMSMQ